MGLSSEYESRRVEEFLAGQWLGLTFPCQAHKFDSGQRTRFLKLCSAAKKNRESELYSQRRGWDGESARRRRHQR